MEARPLLTHSGIRSTTFAHIEEWLNFLLDKRIFIEVEIKGNGYPILQRLCQLKKGWSLMYRVFNKGVLEFTGYIRGYKV